jgi:hypothetical protein
MVNSSRTLPLSAIDVEINGWMDKPFDREEILGALHDFDGDKALGLDGFIMAFFKHC